MEADRTLLNPFFEGYKLSFDEAVVDYFPLNWKCKNKETDGNVEFQVLADEIYENQLKKCGETVFYLSEEGNLICFSYLKGKSIEIKGPFECFGVKKEEETIFAKLISGGFVTIKDGKTVEIPVNLDGDNFKVLHVKTIESKILIILQKISKVNDMKNAAEKYEKLKEKTAFSFYKVVIGDENVSCDLIGWSLSRPLVSFIRPTGEIILGTSTGIITLDSDDILTQKDESAVQKTETVFDSEDEDDNERFNNCRITEFKTDSTTFQYPELTISGSSVNDLQVATKYLYDVIVSELLTDKSKHLTTFPALNFIQSGKIDKKFSVFAKEFAFIIETSGNVYCYAKPVAREQKSSLQYLVQLNEEVYGWAYEFDELEKTEILFILTSDRIYKLTLTPNLC